MATEALINPAIVTWARIRAGLSENALAKKLNLSKSDKVFDWEFGRAKPTFVQAQKIASVTNIPLGYLFLPTPPQEQLPIPDLRTVGNTKSHQASPEMMDILRQVRQKQEWYKDYLIQSDQKPLPFIGKFNIESSYLDIVNDIRSVLKVPRPEKGSWEDYQSQLIQSAENARILVMRSGIVGANTHRKLQVREFRGFAISDPIAPVIFINSSDAPTARLFTLVHELAHLWIGCSGISDMEDSHSKVEKLCNSVAGEFLVPKQEFLAAWSKDFSVDRNFLEISSMFHVSKLVVAKRALDHAKITAEQYWEFYNSELRKFREKESSGGDFYNTTGAKNSRILSSAVIAETMSGRLLLRDAANLLSITPDKIKTYARKLAL